MTSPESVQRFLSHPWLPALFLLLVAFGAYANTFGHPWVLDDLPVIVNNPDVTSWPAFWADSYPGRPLRELTFLLDHTLFGLEPAGWHFQSNLWHGLNGVLLFLLVRRLIGAPLPAMVAALLFLLHPLQVEVVGNISHRKDLLATFFSLSAMHAYVSVFAVDNAKRWGWLLLTLVCALLAYAGKQTAVALPVVLAAYELAFLPQERRLICRWPLLCWGGILIGVAGGLVWFFRFGGLEAYRQAYLVLLVKVNQVPPFTDLEYLWMVFKSWAFVLLRVVWPLELAPEYLFSAPQGWTDPWVLSGLALAVLLVAVLVWAYVSGHRILLWGLAWFAAFYLVTANLLWPLTYFAADRYLYTPLAGLSLVMVLLLWTLSGDRWQVMAVVAVLLCFVLGGLTIRQNSYWSSHERLWTHAVAVSPQSYPALANLAKAYDDQERYELAIEYYKQAAAVNFSAPEPRYNLGVVYDKLGNRFQALYYFREYLARADNSGSSRESRIAARVRQYVFKKYGVRL